MLLFLCTPIGKHFFRKVRRLVEIGAGEIEDEWPVHDRHLNDPQCVIEGDQFRDIATADFRNTVFLQAQINVAFPAVILVALVDLLERIARLLSGVSR